MAVARITIPDRRAAMRLAGAFNAVDEGRAAREALRSIDRPGHGAEFTAAELRAVMAVSLPPRLGAIIKIAHADAVVTELRERTRPRWRERG